MPQASVDHLKVYTFHGLVFTKEVGKDSIASCPFCGTDGKFWVDRNTSKFHCWTCEETGNSTTFIRKLYELCEAEEKTGLEELVEERGYLSEDPLLYWGITKSVLTGYWLIPGYNPDGALCQLYQYLPDEKGKKRMMATPTLQHQLFGMSEFSAEKANVIICEGPWSSACLWEQLGWHKRKSNGRIIRSESFNEETCLLHDTNVIGFPGCNVFKEQWLPLFNGKSVTFAFDNDHPKTNKKNGKQIPPAGFSGVQKRIKDLISCSTPPADIQFIAWSGDPQSPINLDLTSGYDVRDHFSESSHTSQTKVTEFYDLMFAYTENSQLSETGEIHQNPPEDHDDAKIKSSGLVPIPCRSYEETIRAWEGCMKWLDGLECAYSAMLACIISTPCVGDQLWLKVISPPSTGKSTLCEAITVSEHIFAKSTIRGFHSGWKEETEGGKKDVSLISAANNKTLVTKDGDTLLQSPNLQQILSEARDIYDRTSRTHYRHGMSNDYHSLSMTWILCGTASLSDLDSSELGERFLDCIIMNGIDSEFEDEVLTKVAQRTLKNMSILPPKEKKEEDEGGDPTPQASHYDPETQYAMQLTGGYVNFLRENVHEILSKVRMDAHGLETCQSLGKFVAFMRARPSERQDESFEREFAPRLVSQITKLAVCMAGAMGKEEVDEEVLRRCRKIAIDTASGVTLEMVQSIRSKGISGIDARSLAIELSRPNELINKMLRFLKKIEVLFHFKSKDTGRIKWKLKRNFNALCAKVLEKMDQQKE